MKIPAIGMAVVMACGMACAETAVVRIGYPEGAKGVRYETRTVELEKTGDASWRFVMHKRILIGRILAGVYAVAAAVNLILIAGSVTLRSPLSSPTADLLWSLRLLTMDSTAVFLGGAVAIAIPCLLASVAILWKKDSVASLRAFVFLLLWADIIIGLWVCFQNPAIIFGIGSNRTFLILANLALHILLIWHISRARRAVISLEVLPESEITGDPFEEFKKDRSEDA